MKSTIGPLLAPPAPRHWRPCGREPRRVGPPRRRQVGRWASGWTGVLVRRLRGPSRALVSADASPVATPRWSAVSRETAWLVALDWQDPPAIGPRPAVRRVVGRPRCRADQRPDADKAFAQAYPARRATPLGATAPRRRPIPANLRSRAVPQLVCAAGPARPAGEVESRASTRGGAQRRALERPARPSSAGPVGSRAGRRLPLRTGRRYTRPAGPVVPPCCRRPRAH